MEHKRSSSGRIDTAVFQTKHRGHFVSMMFLTLTLSLGALGLLLYASMENNRASMSKIAELEHSNIAHTQENTIPIHDPQEIVQQMQDNTPVNNDIETLPPAEELFD